MNKRRPHRSSLSLDKVYGPGYAPDNRVGSSSLGHNKWRNVGYNSRRGTGLFIDLKCEDRDTLKYTNIQQYLTLVQVGSKFRPA